YQALAEEINHIADKTNFNGNTFLNTAAGGTADIKVQLSDTSGDTLTIKSLDAKSITTGTLKVGTGNALDASTASGEITALDTAIQKIADERATFGS
ncbi:flagellin, partial [Bacillus wiedmannii]